MAYIFFSYWLVVDSFTELSVGKTLQKELRECCNNNKKEEQIRGWVSNVNKRNGRVESFTTLLNLYGEIFKIHLLYINKIAKTLKIEMN